MKHVWIRNEIGQWILVTMRDGEILTQSAPIAADTFKWEPNGIPA
jgi:hypothetical protein